MLLTSIDGVQREIKELWEGKDGVNTETKEMWAGIDGVNKQIFSAFSPDPVLDNNDWATIGKASTLGIAESIWSVGDRKGVTLNGMVGEKTYTNLLVYPFILGFNHNRELEGDGLTHFGCFFTSIAGGKDICLDDEYYGPFATTGKIIYNMNHWGSYNHGGWESCDMRYDILGSTDVPPNDYGERKTTNSKGYNPTETCATNPVKNTLLASFPEELRKEMKPITKYTDNIGRKSQAAASVTATKDYLPLLSGFEVIGHITAYLYNINEESFQRQYDYYNIGNYKYKTRQRNKNELAPYFSRSPSTANNSTFCAIDADFMQWGAPAGASIGISPVFAV